MMTEKMTGRRESDSRRGIGAIPVLTSVTTVIVAWIAVTILNDKIGPVMMANRMHPTKQQDCHLSAGIHDGRTRLGVL